MMKKIKQLLKNKKGLQLGDLSPLAIAFVTVAIVLGVSGTVLTDIRSTQTTNSAAFNASTNGLTGVGNLSTWLPTLGTIIAAAVVVGIVATAFAFRS